jgi:glycosyltransferase involved in cell wall biosynthesis
MSSDRVKNNNKTDDDKRVKLKKTVFIVWEPHSPRAKGISESLDANLYILRNKFKTKIHVPLEYVKLFVKTLAILKKDNPQIIICQLPPIFCALSAFVYRYLMSPKCEIVIDMHTAAFDKPWSYLKSLNNWIMKRTYVIIVSNSELKEQDVPPDYRQKTIVLEDMIPNFQTTKEMKYDSTEIRTKRAKSQHGLGQGQDERYNETSCKIAVICSFSSDEPLEEVLNAASSLPGITFYLTHNTLRAKKQLVEKKTDNVIFTGFLEYNDYLSLLAEVDAIIVLTNRDKTMLCGAYETVALQKPLITSNFEPLKRYFYKGAIFVDNSENEIQKAIETVIRRSKELTTDIGDLKEEKRKEWNQKFSNFHSMLYSKR